ncbi:MAG: FtsX-like permease family protein [Acidobacteria bacterium]|nr:FtsX-like permease family protein [Acidobacteriota bacterium]
MSVANRPPRLAAGLLRRMLPNRHRDDVLAELENEYQADVVPARGEFSARVWYWRQALGSVLWHARHGRRGPLQSLECLLQDVRFAWRGYARAPGLGLLSIATIGLGVGVSTTVFSVLNGVVLRPLPYPDSHELVRLWNNWNLSKGVVEELMVQADGFQALHGRLNARATLTGQGEPAELFGAEITPGYLSMLGAVPLAGRFPVVGETVPGESDVVVLAEATWRRLFGGDTDVVGRTIELGGVSTTVVGVAPAEFRPVVRGVEYWKPMTIDPDDFSDYQGVAQVTVIGRLDPSAPADAARVSVTQYAEGVRERSPRAFGESWVDASAQVSLHRVLVGDNRATLWTVMGAAAFVLLTACANVANLLLARASRRRREIAIRLGMGASSGRLARQLLTESVALGALGGAAGVGLAAALLAFGEVVLPAGLPLSEAVRLDTRVLSFALLATFLTSLLFGIGPALRAARLDPQRYLRESAPSFSRSRESARVNRLIVAAEIAMAVVLAIGAGLMLRSLGELNAVDTGLRADGVTTMRIRLPANSRYAEEPDRAQAFRAITERLATVPGVASVGAGTFLPLQSGLVTAVYGVDGVEYPENQPPPNAAFQMVMADYFDTLGIPVLAGRTIARSDVADAPNVGVINRTFAEDAFGGVGEAVGKKATMFGGVEFEVVGVVGDTLQQDPQSEAWAEAFFSFQQGPWWPSMYVLVRGAPDAMPTAASLREAIWELDPQVPILDIRPMTEVVRSATAQPRYLALLLSGFGAVALALGAIGVYGLMSFAVNERTYEFGIKAALGATRRRILQQAVADALPPAVGGLIVGCLVAAGLSRTMQGMLFGVAAHDLVTFAAAPAILFVVALLASYLPARKAARVDPKQLTGAE